MRLWIVSNLFAPDVHGGAVLYADMASWFQEQGHEVRVTTTFPYYPAWRLQPEDAGCALREEIWQGIPVRRVRMYVPARPSGARRLLSDASFFWSLLRRGRFPGWRPDAIITAEPMLSQCLAQSLLYRGSKPVRLIIVQDFVADAAIELGLLKNPLLARLARRLERRALGSASVLTTISPGMLAKLEALVPAPTPRHYVPNWIHRSLAASVAQLGARPPRPPRTLVYSGNLGIKQGLPDFLRHFTALTHDWTLQVHGAGAAAEALQRQLAEQPDARVRLGGVLDDEAYLRLLLGATACVVTQKSGVGANFLPSKVLPCLATGTPILAVCDPGTPLAEEVRAGGFGWVVPPQRAALAAALETLAADPERLAGMSAAAVTWSRRYAADTVLERFAALLAPAHQPSPEPPALVVEGADAVSLQRRSL